ncbi:hypothetical protein CTP10_R43350 [Cupriavidus sp. P-10]|nr:hypothetical protein CTP10_R43350 [Cupriavidus sp. P-10]
MNIGARLGRGACLLGCWLAVMMGSVGAAAVVAQTLAV